jgi:hypothetical protein
MKTSPVIFEVKSLSEVVYQCRMLYNSCDIVSEIHFSEGALTLKPL